MKKKNVKGQPSFDLFSQNKLKTIACKKIKGGIVVVDIISI